jgi:hypothetical protein
MVSEYFLYLHIFRRANKILCLLDSPHQLKKTKIDIHVDVFINSWVLSIKLQTSIHERKTSIVTVAEENITFFFTSTKMRLFLLSS